MTCKDCLHYELCKRIDYELEYHNKSIKEAEEELPIKCRFFKNKSDFQEVKNGEWIAVPSSDMSTGKAYKCSNCEKMRYGVRLPPYCQECGAKMDGGKNE